MQRSEIEQFLIDVRAHFRASLETSEYENASNMFFVTAAEETVKLLVRCEALLGNCAMSATAQGKGCNDCVPQNEKSGMDLSLAADMFNVQPLKQLEDSSYLDMTANAKMLTNTDKGTAKAIGVVLTHSLERNKCKECTVDKDIESNNCDSQIYDICQVSQIADSEATRTTTVVEDEAVQNSDCPYMDLPAGHLIVKMSTKYGQLQRIEKRLFFDQSKKFYCGILSNWLLCYADGPTSSKPSITLNLKSPGIEIEHSGEGKRRDLCFQITTADPNKKFVFQAINEVDAKEWIHATEAAIRGDITAMAKNSRKLPTPPVIKKMAFVNVKSERILEENDAQGDYIYEEPSPLYQMQDSALENGTSIGVPLVLPDKMFNAIGSAKKFDYDVPKCPPQPLKLTENNHTESEKAGLLNSDEVKSYFPTSNDISPEKSQKSVEKLDFQAKIKDVHSKLSSQLSTGPNGKDILKKTSKNMFSSKAKESEATTVITPNASPLSVKELKKQRKSHVPNGSPQKNNDNTNVNNNNDLCSSPSVEKGARNWFLHKLNKTNSSVRNSSAPSPPKCKQSEKENLLNNLEVSDSYENSDFQQNISSNPASPILKNGPSIGGETSSASGYANNKSKVNMIINQFESSGHLSMFSMAPFAGNVIESINSFCESDCNSYETIMSMHTPPGYLMKNV